MEASAFVKVAVNCLQQAHFNAVLDLPDFVFGNSAAVCLGNYTDAKIEHQYIVKMCWPFLEFSVN